MLYCRFEHTTNFEVDDGFKLELTFENGAQAYIEVGTYNFIAAACASICRQRTARADYRLARKVPGGTLQGVARERCAAVQTAAGLTKTMAAARRGNDGYV